MIPSFRKRISDSDLVPGVGTLKLSSADLDLERWLCLYKLSLLGTWSFTSLPLKLVFFRQYILLYLSPTFNVSLTEVQDFKNII